jgi:hypothetical protein
MNFDKDVWKKLESGLPSGEKISARLAMPDISRKLYAGLDSFKQRHLLIPLDGNEEEYNDSQSRGLSVITRELIIKGAEKKRYIDIFCQDISGYIIFDAIANEIAEKLDRGISKEIIIAVISKWRNFWGKPLQELLSHNELIGIFAELWFLYYWLLPRTNNLEAMNRWCGPFLSRHDFEWEGKSVEVKATTNVQSRIHKIHGIEQLSPPEKGELWLFSLRLREEKGAGNTLPTLIALSREKLKEDPDALSKFENILVVLGYSSFYDEEYSKLKFRIVDEKLYNVTNEFPRLVTSSFINERIPSGVGAIEYTINLDGYDNQCIASSPNEDVVDILR